MSCIEFRVANPLSKKVYDADWNSPVRFDGDKNCFWVNPAKLTQKDYGLGKIVLSIKTKDSQTGKCEEETWEKITFDISGMPQLLEQNAARNVQKIDPLSAVGNSYEALFDQYRSAFDSVVQWVRSLPFQGVKSQRDSQFAQFLDGDLVEKDVTFRCGDGDVKAHKFVLISQSPVWKRHFSGEADHIIQVEGVARLVLEKLVQYLYVGGIEIRSDAEAFQIYKLAHLYQIASLKGHCERGYRNESLRLLDSRQLISPGAFTTSLHEMGLDAVGGVFLEAVQRITKLKGELEVFQRSL